MAMASPATSSSSAPLASPTRLSSREETVTLVKTLYFELLQELRNAVRTIILAIQVSGGTVRISDALCGQLVSLIRECLLAGCRRFDRFDPYRNDLVFLLMIPELAHIFTSDKDFVAYLCSSHILTSFVKEFYSDAERTSHFYFECSMMRDDELHYAFVSTLLALEPVNFHLDSPALAQQCLKVSLADWRLQPAQWQAQDSFSDRLVRQADPQIPSCDLQRLLLPAEESMLPISDPRVNSMDDDDEDDDSGEVGIFNKAMFWYPKSHPSRRHELLLEGEHEVEGKNRVEARTTAKDCRGKAIETTCSGQQEPHEAAALSTTRIEAVEANAGSGKTNQSEDNCESADRTRVVSEQEDKHECEEGYNIQDAPRASVLQERTPSAAAAASSPTPATTSSEGTARSTTIRLSNRPLLLDLLSSAEILYLSDAAAVAAAASMSAALPTPVCSLAGSAMDREEETISHSGPPCKEEGEELDEEDDQKVDGRIGGIEETTLQNEEKNAMVYPWHAVDWKLNLIDPFGLAVKLDEDKTWPGASLRDISACLSAKHPPHLKSRRRVPCWQSRIRKQCRNSRGLCYRRRAVEPSNYPLPEGKDDIDDDERICQEFFDLHRDWILELKWKAWLIVRSNGRSLIPSCHQDWLQSSVGVATNPPQHQQLLQEPQAQVGYQPPRFQPAPPPGPAPASAASPPSAFAPTSIAAQSAPSTRDSPLSSCAPTPRESVGSFAGGMAGSLFKQEDDLMSESGSEHSAAPSMLSSSWTDTDALISTSRSMTDAASAIGPSVSVPPPFALRMEWTLELKPRYTKLQHVTLQRGLCGVCQAKLSTSSLFSGSNLKFCHYLGALCCTQCHRGETRIIPARVCEKWDFEERGVCSMAASFLDAQNAQPIIPITRIRQSKLSSQAPLKQMHELRMKLGRLKEALQSTECGFFDTFDAIVSSQLPEHMSRGYENYSMEDLAKLCTVGKHWATFGKLERLMRIGTDHVEACTSCQKTSAGYCGICASSRPVFAFDFPTFQACSKCRAVYHQACFKHAGFDCPKCLNPSKHVNLKTSISKPMPR